MIATIEQTIEIDVPVRTAYDQWTQFESFPLFMEHVVEVRQVDDSHLHWVAEIGGSREEWDAEIVAQRPDEVVAWRSVDGAQTAGRVEFDGDDVRTKLTLRLEYDPSGAKERLGAAIGVDSMSVREDLERFKALVEGMGRATDGWRGTIAEGSVEEPARGDAPEGSLAGEVDPTRPSDGS